MKNYNLILIFFLTSIAIFYYSCRKYYKLAAVETGEIGNISLNSAIVNGFVIDIGEMGLLEHGHCWDTIEYPTLVDNRTELGIMDSIGVYQSNLDDLHGNTAYYVRAYGTNIDGTVYGEQKSFKTEENLTSVTDYDGNIYEVIEIGKQLWMAENLKVTHYADGIPIQRVTSNNEWYNLTNSDKAYCYYNNNANGEAIVYGALYTWAAAMNGESTSNSNPSGVQGVCPSGWHLPSDKEWKELELYLGMSQDEIEILWERGTDEGGQLKEIGFAHWISPNSGATNSTKLSALPGGYRANEGVFIDIGYSSYFWSTREFGWGSAYGRVLLYNKAQIHYSYDPVSEGHSVRCIKDR